MNSKRGSRPLRVAFAGGGSGGHLFPALAVRDALLEQRPDLECLFLTSSRAIDAQVLANCVAQSKSRITAVPYISDSGSVRIGKRIRRLVSGLRALRRARRVLSQFQPDVMIGLGAFASVPAVIVASRIGLPVVLMEQNVVPGRASRSLAQRAQLMIAGLPLSDSIRKSWPCPVHLTGVPIRASIKPERWSSKRSTTDRDEKPMLLVLGGSQGARRINDIVISTLSSNSELLTNWTIVHQSGEADVARVTSAYRETKSAASVVPFVNNLPMELARATLVISRAGAGTLQELAACGCPAILVPLSSAADGHQAANATWMKNNGGAVVIDEQSTDAVEQLRAMLASLTSSRLPAMSAAQHRLARPSAAHQAAELILQLVK